VRLKQAAKDANTAIDIAQLLGIEGAAAATYFKHFQGMLKVDDDNTESPKQLTFSFDFTIRNRRPPKDPVNALLSLGYSLLAKGGICSWTGSICRFQSSATLWSTCAGTRYHGRIQAPDSRLDRADIAQQSDAWPQ
jgi:hypothetical protein